MRSDPSPSASQALGVLFLGLLLATLVSTLKVGTTLGAVSAVGLLIIFLSSPKWGLLLVLLARASSDAFTSYAFVGGGILGGLANLGLGLILTVAGAAYVLSRGVPLISLPGGRLLTLLLLTGFVGVARSNSQLYSLRQWIPLLTSFVVYALAARVFTGSRQTQRVVDVIGLSFILPAAFGVQQLVTGGFARREFEVPTAVGTFVHPNIFGHFLVMIIALFLGQAVYQAGRRRGMAAAIVFLAFGLLLGTYARAAWGGALIVLLTFGILQARIFLVLIPIASLAIFGSGLLPSVALRVADPLGPGSSLAARVFEIWPATLQAWLSTTGSDGAPVVVLVNRLAGLGPGIGVALSRYGLSGQPHNDYLRVLVEYGIFGLVLYVALAIVLVVMAYRIWRQVRSTDQTAAAVPLSFLALALAFPVISITDNVFAQTVDQLYFWTLAGLAAGVGASGRGRESAAEGNAEGRTLSPSNRL